MLSKIGSKIPAPLINAKNKFMGLSKPKKALVIGAVALAVIAIAGAVALLYAKFGHNPSMNSWMNHQFQPFFTDKLGPWLAKAAYKAGDFLSSHQLPTWVPVALGTTAALEGTILGGLLIKGIYDRRKKSTVEPEEEVEDQETEDKGEPKQPEIVVQPNGTGNQQPKTEEKDTTN